MVAGRVYIAYTGGTIGMKVAGRGLRPAPGLFEELFWQMPEFRNVDRAQVVIREYKDLIDSANAKPTDWENIALDIQDNYEDFDGFVVVHGTDTLAYTASALSFLLEYQRKPVVVTGSQVPLVYPRTDGRNNLAASVELASRYPKLNQVVVCFGSKILRGNRTTKTSTSHFDAFESPKVADIGSVGIRVRLEPHATRAKGKAAFDDTPFSVSTVPRRPTVGSLRLFPGIQASFISSLVSTGVDGLVLEAYGSGTAPDEDEDLMKALREGVDAGVSIVAVSQTLRGRTSLSTYAASSALRDCGVLDGRDMTTEAATTKLYYLLAQDRGSGFVRAQMNRSIRGEVSIPRRRRASS